MTVDPLRPQTLSEFGGQPDISRELGIVLAAAKARNELPDHILFSGPPGLGKTTLAHVCATELGKEVVVTSGPAIERPGDVASLLTGLGSRVLFIDEIHRMPRQAEEILYPAMEDGRLDLIIGEGAKARTVSIPLTPFVLIGATTQSGLLSAPLRDRFGFTPRLQLYSAEDLSRIVSRNADLLGVSLNGDAAGVIATRSRGTPRIANRWTRRVRDWAQVEGITDVDGAAAAAALEAFGVDSIGLDTLGRELLTALCTQFAGGPVGVATLAAAVGEAVTTLEEVYEPFLMNQGMLARTPRGRIATDAAWAHLNLPR